MTWQDAMTEALAGYLREVHYVPIKNILDWEETTDYGGYCDTCFYEETNVCVTYADDSDEIQTYFYSGSMAELIRGITE